jgi:hypothetical protein
MGKSARARAITRPTTLRDTPDADFCGTHVRRFAKHDDHIQVHEFWTVMQGWKRPRVGRWGMPLQSRRLKCASGVTALVRAVQQIVRAARVVVAVGPMGARSRVARTLLDNLSGDGAICRDFNMGVRATP